MARPISTIRTVSKNIRLSEDVVAKMELALFSEAEGRIPVGAQAELIKRLLRAHFNEIERAARRASKEAIKAELADPGVEGG